MSQYKCTLKARIFETLFCIFVAFFQRQKFVNSIENILFLSDTFEMKIMNNLKKEAVLRRRVLKREYAITKK